MPDRSDESDQDRAAMAEPKRPDQSRHPIGDGGIRRRSRRVTTPPPTGSDPNPAPEPPRSSGHENDDRMRAEKPPHY